MRRLILGPRAVLEAIQTRPDAIHVIYFEESSAPRLGELIGAAERHNVAVEPRDSGQLEVLVEHAPTQRHGGVVAVGGDYPYVSLDEVIELGERIIMVLDEITDPHNFGAIVRSAVCLGARGVVTLRNRAAPVTATVVRTSAGATEHAKIARVANLRQAIRSLQAAGYFVVGLDAHASAPLNELTRMQPRIALVVGSEGRGLRRLTRETCDALGAIPMHGGFDSLNASVASALALYICVTSEANEEGTEVMTAESET